jgi:predicted extracellular nuclease
MSSHFMSFVVLVVYLVFPLSVSAKGDSANDNDYVLPVAANELKIMSYNVQNLFDAQHDADKYDYEFLPAKDPEKKNCEKDDSACAGMDWTLAKIDLKISHIKAAIEAQGALPDVLVLVEVENPNIVGQLARALGYGSFDMTNSPDERGIDCAILYRTDKLTKISYQEREVQDLTFATRNLSALTFRLNSSLGGGVLSVFANHWPSQLHEDQKENVRVMVARQLRSFVDEYRAKYSSEDFHSVLTGDFNTLEEESPNPIGSVLLDSRWSAKMSDVRALAIEAHSPMIPKMPQATYYYGSEEAWNEFDHFIVDRSLNDEAGLDVDPMSYRIHAPTFLTKTNDDDEKIPFRHNPYATNPNNIGYSDHFAVVMKLKYTK